MKKRCFNCAHCNNFNTTIEEFNPLKDDGFICLCGATPVGLDGYIMSLQETKEFVCDYWESEDEFKESMFEDAKEAYIVLKMQIAKLEQEYPELKDLNL